MLTNVNVILVLGQNSLRTPFLYIIYRQIKNSIHQADRPFIIKKKAYFHLSFQIINLSHLADIF